MKRLAILAAALPFVVAACAQTHKGGGVVEFEFVQQDQQFAMTSIK